MCQITQELQCLSKFSNIIIICYEIPWYQLVLLQQVIQNTENAVLLVLVTGNATSLGRLATYKFVLKCLYWSDCTAWVLRIHNDKSECVKAHGMFTNIHIFCLSFETVSLHTLGFPEACSIQQSESPELQTAVWSIEVLQTISVKMASMPCHSQ